MKFQVLNQKVHKFAIFAVFKKPVIGSLLGAIPNGGGLLFPPFRKKP